MPTSLIFSPLEYAFALINKWSQVHIGFQVDKSIEIMDLRLEKKLGCSTTFFDIDSVFWLKCATSTGSIIIFWGSPEDGKRNIDALKNQVFPVDITIESLEDYVSDHYVSTRYKARWSIPENVQILINPEL